MPPFAVSQFTTWHQTFEQDIELYHALGVECIEVCERKLSTDPGKARDQLAALRDKGLRVSSVQPRVHALFQDSMCPDLLDPDERANRYRATIDLIADAFPGECIPLVAISGNAPGYNFRLAHQTARRIYPDLADYAADRGLRVMFEPLSPILMNADSFVCGLDDAMRLIDDVDRENFGLMLDVWHLWWERSIAQRITDVGDRIFGVHVCDWPHNEPRHVGDRVLPGDGVIDLPSMLGAIEDTGYTGAYCLEIFSIDALPDSLWRAEPAGVIRRGRDGFNKAWEQRR